MTIPIATTGRIRNEGVQEQYIMVCDDLKNTGGYLVLQSEAPDFATGHDCWVLENALEDFFHETGWEIDWLIGGSTDV